MPPLSRSTRLRLRLAAAIFALVFSCALFVPPAGAQAVTKKPVTSASDLPRFTYPIDVAPSVLVQADAADFKAFAEKVRANIESVLAGYDIRDRATLRGLLEQRLEWLGYRVHTRRAHGHHR